jgi:two-component system chemotaxis sensor kinase CheA
MRLLDPARLQVARLTVVFAVCLTFWAPVYCVIFALVGAVQLAKWTAVTGTIIGAAPLLLRFTGRQRLASHVVLVGLGLLLTAIAGQTRGVYSPALSWLLVLPLMAMTMLGMRASAIWAATVVIAGSFWGALAVLGVAVPDTITGVPGALYVASSIPTLAVLVFSLAATFELAKNQMGRELATARDAATEAHVAARLILDAVDQGLFMLAEDGTVKLETSHQAQVWFGPCAPSTKVWTWLESSDADAATWAALGHEAWRDDVLPVEVTLAQMPQTMCCGERTLRLQWLPIAHRRELLVVVSDVTAMLVAERSERAQRELVVVLQKLSTDRRGFFEFLNEANDIVERIGASTDDVVLAREVHTLKGNAALFGLTSVSAACHAFEGELLDHPSTSAERAGLVGAWTAALEMLRPFVGARDKNVVEIPRTDLDAVLSAITERRPHDDVAQLVRQWTREPTRVRLERAAEQVRGLAARLGKSVDIVIEDNGLRLEPERFAPFWAAFAHAVRNAIDHGVEPVDERVAAGKPEQATITLRTSSGDDGVTIAIAEDGRGIDWDRVCEKARARGLVVDTPAQRIEALFADGVSTAMAVSDLSGRGVGMSALRAVTEGLGGQVDVVSRAGQGTTMSFRLPTEQQARMPHAAE